MSDNEDLLAIRVISAANQVAAIKIIRAATGLSMTEIRTALANGSPLKIARLYGLDHDDHEQTANRLFEDLDEAGVEFEIMLNGEPESRQFFSDLMERWRDIGVQTDMMTDLESGEPCIETLQWLQSTGTDDVFQQTIRQIINADGYQVDATTLEWAKQQLNDA